MAFTAIVALWANGCSSAAPSLAIQGLPGPYEYDFSIVLTTEDKRPRDSNGIIMVEYPSGVEYNPVTVAQSALAHYDRWLDEGRASDRSEFLKDAEWLVSTQKDDGLWYYEFPNAGMPVPWVSGMAQGHACSVLVRAYAISGDTLFRDAATHSLATFELPVGSGGVSMVDGGYTYYEEAMPPVSPHILNGMVFAMYGALDMATVLGDERARAIWQAGVDTLAANMGKYDSGGWSLYAQGSPRRLATHFYHDLHIELLRELYSLTGRDEFLAYQQRFEAYADKPPPDVPK